MFEGLLLMNVYIRISVFVTCNLLDERVEIS